MGAPRHRGVPSPCGSTPSFLSPFKPSDFWQSPSSLPGKPCRSGGDWQDAGGEGAGSVPMSPGPPIAGPSGIRATAPLFSHLLDEKAGKGQGSVTHPR